MNQRKAVTQQLGNFVSELYALEFDTFGSLYHDGSSFRVGPIVEQVSSLHRHIVLEDHGPWQSDAPFAHLCALAAREQQWIHTDSGQQLLLRWRGEMYPEEDVTTILPALIELTDGLVDLLPLLESSLSIPDNILRPTLNYGDFHTSNILVSTVDPTIVTGIIDWEFSSVTPFCETSYMNILDDDKLQATFDGARYQGMLEIRAAMEDAGVPTKLSAFRDIRDLVTSGVSLYLTCIEVYQLLSNIRGYLV